MTKRFLTGLQLNNNSISGVVAASLATDVPNWGQVQAFVNGLTFKTAVRVASVANVTVATPGASIDGVTLNTGDRILLKDQTTSSEKGLYIFNGASSPLTRAPDGVQGELTSTATVVVQEGTTNADRQYTLVTINPITVGTTAQTWNQSGAGTTYTADGVNILLTGTVFSLNTAVVPRKYAANVGDGTSTAIVVTHNLGTRDVQIQIVDNTTYDTVEADVVRTSTNTATITFSTAPTSAQFRVLVVG